MDQRAESSVGVERPSGSGAVNVAWRSAAVLAHLAFLDAAAETFWSGSPLRWWLSPGLLLCGLGSAWIWRPGGRLLLRFGPAAAASTAVLALLAALAVSAWLPGGLEGGVRMFLQPTSKVLAGVVALGTAAASLMIVRRVTFLPATPRLAVRAVVALLGLYAVAALIIGVLDNTPFVLLFNGGAAWQRAPRWLQGTAVATFFIMPVAFVAAFVSGIRTGGVAGMKRSGLWTPSALILVLAMAFSGYHAPAGREAAASGVAGDARGSDTVGAAEPDRATETVGTTETIRAAETVRAAGLGLRDAGTLDPAAAADRVRYLLEQLPALQTQVPRETFDPQAIVAAVGTEPGSLFAWVRDKTFWAPYRGSLRGPTGVLMDRLGSSLDRSLLLAELLRRAGRKVRLAHAQLAPGLAQALLDRARAIPPVEARLPPEPATWDQRQEEMLSGYAARFSRDPEAFLDAAKTTRRAALSEIAGARRTAREQAAVLAASIPGDVPPRSSDDALAAAADHWWVQYEQDASWVDLDPTPSDAVPGQAITSAASVSDQVPQASRWMLSISVVVEAWSRGRLTERRVLTHRVAASDAAWQDITLAHAPLTFPDPASLGTDAAAWRSAALGVHEWVPVLMVGRKRVSQASFRDDGTVNDRPGQRGGGLTSPGGLFGALGGGEAAAAADGILTAEWIDYEIQGPGVSPRRSRRTGFDLVGPKARAAVPVPAPALAEAIRTERGLSLLGETAIHVQVCRPSSAFLADRMLQRLSDNRAGLLALMTDAAPSKATRDSRTLLSRLAPASNVLWRWAAERFQGSEVGGGVFLAAPGVATFRSEVVAEPGRRVRGRGVFDIVANDVSVLPPGARGGLFRTRIEQGVADTIAEGSGVRAGNTSEVFRAAAALAVPTRLIASRERGWVRPPGVSEDVLARIDADVSSGHHLLLPERPVAVAGSPSFGWWRVEAASGTTVGVMDSGYHQGLSEYIDQVSEAGVGLIVGYIVADWTWDHTAEERDTFCSILGGLLVLAGAALLVSAGVDVEISVSFGK